MSKITITIDDKELMITSQLDETTAQMLIHNSSQVPEKRGDDELFNKLRDVALEEWHKNCISVITNFLWMTYQGNIPSGAWVDATVKK